MTLCYVIENQNKKKMKKSEFKKLFESELTKQGRAIEPEKVKSAIDKLARHMRNRDGCVEWDEGEIDNAIYYYNEFKVSNTFNRGNMRINHD